MYFPLASVQREIWFEQALYPGIPIHSIGGYVRINGCLDVALFAQALTQLVAEHEVLRTQLSEVDGLPQQVFAERLDWPFALLDFSALAQPKTAAIAVMQDQFQRPFRLLEEPLFRYALFKLSETRFVWMGIHHHLIVDGWAASLITHRVAELYNALLSGEVPKRSGEHRYPSFIARDAAYLESPQFEAHRDFWAQKFKHMPEPLLPIRAEFVQNHKVVPGSIFSWQLPRARYRELESLAKAQGVTTFHALIALLYVYFSRTQDRDECVIGLPVLNRNKPSLKKTIGLFASMIPARFRFGLELGFATLLKAIARVLREDYRHQQFPLSEINRLAKLFENNQKRLFDISLSYQKHDYAARFSGCLPSEAVSLNHGFEQLPLAVSVGDYSEMQDLQIGFAYNQAYFNDAEIQRLQQRFLCLLETVLAQPEQSIARVSFLPESERQLLLSSWNATNVGVPDHSLHAVFEAQVRKTPEALALIDGREEVRFDCLNIRANQLAYALKRLGVTADSAVAIALPRNQTMMVGLLAILKAGGLYVPLDPSYPYERLQLMAEDCGARILLTLEPLRAQLPALEITLCLDKEAIQLSANPRQNLGLTATPFQLAYLIYTSGSTGRPKGVLCTHRGAINRFSWMWAAYPFRSGEVCAWKTTLNFVDSVWEAFGPLLQGLPLVLVPDEVPKDLMLFIKTLADSGVTRLVLVPSLLRTMLDLNADLAQRLPKLWHWTCSGEALALELAGRFRSLLPGRVLLNLYGSSEVAADVTAYEVRGEELAKTPIGRPIANTQVYLLDRHLEPTPRGVVGMAYLGGAGLARGYHRRPGLCASQFIPDPFSGSAGSRLFRTGDLLRYRYDGELIYVGRADHQVKIRGFRVELGEIEAALRGLPSVREAVLMTHGEGAEQQLVAYVVADHVDEVESPAETVRPARLRAALKASLPDFMLPTAWVFLENLPLTPNGKVNRLALPKPDRQGFATVGVTPRDTLEEIISGLWATVLKQPSLCIHDNFFELGGHSLQATQLAARLHEALAVEVPVRWLFETPSVAGLAERVRPLLADPNETGNEITAQQIPVVARNQLLPLSFAQQRLWFLDQLEGPSPTYNLPIVLELVGQLDLWALRDSLNEIVARHETLRTRLVSQNGEPYQEIEPAWSLAHFPLNVLDLCGTTDPNGAAAQLADREALRVFDLARDKPLRTHLIRRTEAHWTLLLTLHHSASDGWSMAILVREFMVLYTAFQEGRPSPLVKLEVQYADVAQWQRGYLSGAQLAYQIEVWRARLIGSPECLHLPSDQPRPPRQSFRGANHAFELGPDLTAALKELSRRSGATLFMTLLTGWASLLARYSGEEDLVIGSPVANRTKSAMEPLIGFFVNTLPLRVDLSGQPSFLTLLAQVRTTCLEAFSHQSLPFEALVESLGTQRSLAHAPLFQVMFVLQNNIQEQMALPGLLVTQVSQTQPSAKFDLTLTLSETEGQLKANLEYAVDLFEATTMVRYALHFQRLLTAAMAQPEKILGDLSLLSTEEQQLLLVTWNDTSATIPEGGIHTFVEAQAARNPAALALVSEERSLTYGELNELANQLAFLLLERGVGCETPVALALERSTQLIVALVAILKAGGFYVPMDPSYPEERLRFFLENSTAVILVSETPLRERLPESSVPRLWLDQLGALLSQSSCANPAQNVAPNQLAYLIYTSGSTGQPKGVAASHRGAINRFAWMWRRYPFGEGEVQAQKTTLNFVDSVWEIFGPLAQGQVLYLVPSESTKDVPLLVTQLGQAGVTRLVLVPSLLHVLLDLFPDLASRLPNLWHWTCSGEALSAELALRFRRQLPDRLLLNLYGSSEVAADVTFAEIQNEHLSCMPIGRPIANTRIYVLDHRLQPVAQGLGGACFVGGAGLARGYHHRPELTAQQFLPDPFSETGGQRLFRTGDQVRYRNDGALEFLGRVDHQVKIRGFRIELAEVEKALQALAQIEEAVVVVRGEAGAAQLVAYVVARAEVCGTLTTPAAQVQTVRLALKQTLPDFMVPSTVVFLNELPRTPNGKISRLSLPDPEPSNHPKGRAPQDELEILLVDLWMRLLPDKRPSIDDNFFELGGHSLLATQLVARLSEALALSVPVRWLFEAPTIAQLAERLRTSMSLSPRGTSGADETGARQIGIARRDRPIPLSFAQQRLWFLDQLEGPSALYNLALGLEVEGLLDVAALARALGEILLRHESLRTCLVSRDGIAVQAIQPAGAPELFPLVLIDVSQSHAPEAIAKELAGTEALRPFALERDLPLRASLIDRGDSRFTLLLTLHHSAADGWSMTLLIRELMALYAAFRQGRPSPLAELSRQYADFSVWQRGYLSGPRLERQLAYWAKRLHGAPECLGLCTDRPRPARQSYRGGSFVFALDPDLKGQIEALERQTHVTLFMILLSAWSALLARYSGENDLVVGTPVANRTLPSIEPLIGFFVNTLALRMDLAGQPSFRQLLGRVSQVCLEAYSYQEVPFESMIAALEIPRSLAHAPLFQVMCVLQNNAPSVLSMPGLVLSPLDQIHPSAKFDLTLTCQVQHDVVRAQLEYASDLFDPATIERMAGHFGNLLTAAVAHPDTVLAQLDFLSPDQRQQLLVEWQGEPLTEPLHSVMDMFAAQVAHAPEAIALYFEGVALTYRQLDDQVKHLAQRMLRLGVAPETLVAICLERSPELVVSVLATWKTGAGLVPLDPAHPISRLSYMLDDSRSSLLISTSQLSQNLPPVAPVLALDSPEDASPSELAHLPEPLWAPEFLAYVIYTSGSTGRPKGVAVEHGQISAHCQVIKAFYDLTPNDRVLQFASFSFDLALEQMLPTLCAGAALVLPSHGLFDPEKLDQLILEQRVSVAHLPPALFEQWLSLRSAGVKHASLRLMGAGGDVFPPSLHRHWFAKRTPLDREIRLLNGYGPTETTITATFFEVPSDLKGRPVSIGRPLPGRAAFVLDRQLALVPVGAQGELLLGGFLARGYLGRAALSARQFIPHPFATIPGDRLYRSGDLVRYRPDGTLEFLGRIDQQVKVRGFRIELGEIESALTALAGIVEALVLVRGTEQTCQLVAYLVPQRTQPSLKNGPETKTTADIADPRSLRQALLLSLPEYMIPSAWVFLEAWPLTPNGKIDRKALPEPKQPDESSEGGFARNALEEMVLGIWATVLDQPRLGIHDNFFELGGHSLLATQLSARLEASLGVAIPVRWVFEAPQVATLTERVRALLEGSSAVSDQARQITRVSRERPLPLSFGQQRLWFLDQLEGPSATYLMATALDLHGLLDPAALVRALGELSNRHEVLRTRLVLQGPQPIQVVQPAQPNSEFPLTWIDLRACAEPEAEAILLARKATNRPFDLATEVPLRAQLLLRADRAWTLLLTLHHCAADGWSLALLVRELLRLYSAFRQGQPSPLGELSIQYGDFAVWQRGYLSGTRLQQLREVWSARLDGAPEQLNLASDRPRPAQQSYRGASLSLLLEPELLAELESLSRRSGVTLFMTLLASWASLLGRYSGEQDLVIGTPVANRTHPAIEPLIGFFVNTLALRLDLRGKPNIHELLARIRSVCLEAYAHQDLPLEMLLESLNVPRNLAFAPLFQVLCVLQNTPREDLVLPELEMTLINLPSTVAKYDLSLVAQFEKDGIHLGFEFATDLFESATIQRRANHLRQLLRAVVANPELAMVHQNILTEEESQQILVDWQGPKPSLLSCSVIDLIEAQVSKNPEATALRCAGETFTFSELDQRVNLLAWELKQRGVVPETLVAIAIERSAAMVTAMLAVWKLGAAYLPLDPSYPAERLTYLLQDSGSALLLSQGSSCEPWVPANLAKMVIHLSAGAELGSVEAFPRPAITADQLAYVIYTSGSTGQPKGVSISQRALSQHCQVIQTCYGLVPSDSVIQLASFSFDVSLEQIVPTLCAGATLCVPPPGLIGPRDLSLFLEANRVSVLNLPPILFEAWLTDHHGEWASCLRLVVVGGEMLSTRQSERWFAFLAAHAHARPIRLLNAYGPTEATITATLYPVVPGHQGPSVPLGRPLPGRTCAILDRHMEHCPIGMAGELHLGGNGLAQGYLLRPRHTAAVLVPNPSGSGQRLYKTGDRARYRPDGTIECLGRLDHQVKIRGFRIELGEVEAALLDLEQVREAVVLARESAGAQQLVAYIVADLGEAPTPDNGLEARLQERLRARLPEFMIPSAWVFLEALPLLPNAKLDLRALPAPEQRVALSQALGPLDGLEEFLLDLWRALLRQDQLTVGANFFELGGHSLLATQMVTRLGESLGRVVPLRWVFEAPTVSALAARLRGAPRNEADLDGEVEARHIPVTPRDQPLPLSFAQQRLWFLDQLEGPSPTYNIPAALELRGRVCVATVQKALSEIVRRHESLRTRLVSHQGQGFQQVLLLENDWVFPLALVDLSQEADAEARAQGLSRQEALRSFDLSHDLPLRVCLLRRHDACWSLLLTLHHSAADGWSVTVLIREFSDLYRAFLNDLPSPLPDLVIQYADFAVWQRGYLSGRRLQQLRDTWAKRLDGAGEVLGLPCDRARPPQQTYRGATYDFFLDASRMVQLEALSRGRGVTLFMALYALWASLLSRYSGQTDLVIGTPVANRTQTAIEPLIGFFVNTLALRVALCGRPNFSELLTRVRQTCLEAYAHQELPFEALIETLDLSRSLAHAPLFQVMFVLQNNPIENLYLPGIETNFLPIQQTVAQFDLTLTVSRTTSGYQASLEYASDLFEQTTIRRLSEHFCQLLGGVLDQPEADLTTLAILSQEERQRLLVDWQTAPVAAVRECVVVLFERQVRHAPQAPAILYEGEELCFEKLNIWANRVAHELIQLRVGPESLVAIGLRRSPAMIVALLAVLKAGAAYVPLDPDYPTERLSFMMADCGAQVLLSEPAVSQRLPHSGSTLAVTELPFQPEPRSTQNPERAIDLDQLAYVIYTSGSTGQPKGVTIAHRGLSQHCSAIVETFSLTPSDRVLQFASFCFDASIEQILPTLCVGAAVCLPLHGPLLPADLGRCLLRHRVSIADLPPAYLELCLSEGAFVLSETQLRLVTVGGDAPSARLIARWYEETAGIDRYISFLNCYGPTEATIAATFYELPRLASGANVALGPILPCRTAYVVDKRLDLQPIGVAGELCLGGSGIARGYLNHPALTARQFIPDPFAERPGQRLYKSGDLVRYRVDGLIEFLGRVDFQVKIRGLRIELGEIEAALAALPGKHESLVLARGPQGARELVAYLVSIPVATGVSSVAELRQALLARLPEYMVPTAWVFLDAWPLTPSGKIDRKALPEPVQEPAENKEEAPRTRIEKVLANLWAEVLGRTQVGIQQTFFELGGHSLLAIQLVGKMRRALGRDVPVRMLFEAPTIALLAQRLEGEPSVEQTNPGVPANLIRPGSDRITPDLLPLISLSQAEIDRLTVAVGGTSNFQDVYPLTPLQEGMLFHHQIEEVGDAYVGHWLLRCDNRARVDAFLEAFRFVIARHDILRTSFHWDGLAQAVQVVWREVSLEVVEVSFDPSKGEIREQLLAAYRPDQTRIELQRAPLLRLYLTEEDGHWLLLLFTHHLILDHTGLEIILSEIAAFAQARQQDLAEPVPFRNFVAQTHNTPEEEHEGFFREMLGSLERPTLPFGLSNVLVHGSQEEAVQAVPADLAEQIRVQARRHEVSPAALCHLAWALVLGRCSGQDDVVFGTVLFGRMLGGLGIERALGLFINTLPLRVKTRSFSAAVALKHTHQQLLRLMDHEHASLSLAQRCCGFPVTPETPLFSALFNYRHSPTQKDKEPRLEGFCVLQTRESTNYPMMLSIDDLGEGFVLCAQVMRIDPTRICAFMLASLGRLVELLGENAQTYLDNLDLLPESERRILLQNWNQTAVDLPSASIHRLIEEQVRRTPSAIAVIYESEVLSYAQLNARANRLAHALMARGVGPETRVAVGLFRSCELIIALLATLKAGGAYVPLDLDYPAERIAFLLEDSSAAFVISQQALAERLPSKVKQPLYLDHPLLRLEQQPSTNPEQTCHPQQLAYVIYTSGSTGQPKGAALGHRGIVARLVWAQRAFPQDASDRILQKTPASFDVSVWELFWPLQVGAVQVFARPGGHRDNDYMCALIARTGITTIHFVPSMMALFLEQPGLAESCRSLRQVFCSGEELPASLQTRFFERLPECRLSNLYGPTEASIDVTWYICQPADNHQRVPIGRPIDNTQCYILNPRLLPTPIGVPGQLWLGGFGLARGYLNRPALSASSFIPDPFAQEPGLRLYKTGDLACYRNDGEVEFLGRLDHQVKVRGFRIELGEIDSILQGLAQVHSALVLVRGNEAQRQLVAYVVLSNAPNPEEEGPGSGAKTRDQLREALQRQLPDYMVPTAWVFLPSFPLSPNGKVDRKALPEPGAHVLEKMTVAPRDRVERELLEIWMFLLGTRSIGVEDHFFNSGGHSLLALRLVAEVARRFEQPVPLSRLFECATIASMADWLRNRGVCPEPSCLVPIRKTGSRQPLFFVPGIDGSIAYLYPLVQCLDQELPFFAFQAQGLEGNQAPFQSLTAMAAHYVALVLEVQPEGPYALGGHSFGGIVAYAMAQQLLAQGASIEKLVLIDSHDPSNRPQVQNLSAEAPLHPAELHELLLGLEQLYAQTFDFHSLRELTMDQQVDEVAVWLASKNFLPPGAGAAYLWRLLKLVRAHVYCWGQYRSGPERPVALELILASEALDSQTQSLVPEIDPELGWRPFVGTEVRSQKSPGNHFSMMRPPHVTHLANLLDQALLRGTD